MKIIKEEYIYICPEHIHTYIIVRPTPALGAPRPHLRDDGDLEAQIM